MTNRSRKDRKWALLAVSAGLLSMVVIGLYWRELRARYILSTQFEKAPGKLEFLHRDTGIAFEVRVDD